MKLKAEYLNQEVYCSLISQNILICEENKEILKLYNIDFVFEEQEEEKPKKK
jgi:hypothetical protein